MCHSVSQGHDVGRDPEHEKESRLTNDPGTLEYAQYVCYEARQQESASDWSEFVKYVVREA